MSISHGSEVGFWERRYGKRVCVFVSIRRIDGRNELPLNKRRGFVLMGGEGDELNLSPRLLIILGPLTPISLT